VKKPYKIHEYSGADIAADLFMGQSKRTTDAVRDCMMILFGMAYVRRATKYIDEDRVVKVTRQFPMKLNERQRTYIVTVGKPNYAERTFIKKCKAAGESFPVRKIQLTTYPVKKVKRAA
jgi:hypothetical protein